MPGARRAAAAAAAKQSFKEEDSSDGGGDVSDATVSDMSDDDRPTGQKHGDSKGAAKVKTNGRAVKASADPP